MNKKTQSSHEVLGGGFEFFHTAEEDLNKMMHDAEHCFGSVKRYACSDIYCQWKAECHEVGNIWMI
ncbi:MAG: hypothetical protein KGZ83_01650 [Sulfuricella sp.]|nr:hypothetical protein [Sulfuricella sp.]